MFFDDWIKLAAAGAIAATGVTPAGAAPLAAWLGAAKWKTRPVIIAAASDSDPRFKAQLAAFEHRQAALVDYDITLLPLAAPDAAQRKRLGLKGDFAVILIGKDGGEKGRWTAPVDPQRLFAEIDTMPMREQEKQR